MKATKVLFTAILVFTVIVNAFSQKYHPFLNNSSWVAYDIGCCKNFPDVTIEEGVDEVIGGITYTKFLDPFSFPKNAPVYLRENCPQRKVYKLVNGAEVLLYDFSLKNGNTISLNGLNYTATVDEITVIGDTRKRITLKSDVSADFCNKSVTQVWIEGVGSVSHPFNPGYNMAAQACSAGGGIQILTKCSFQNGVQVFGSPNCVTYHPFLNNSSWLIYDWVSCCRPPVEKVIPEGTDEVIAGKTYKKFIDPFGSAQSPTAINTVYVREDIQARKVYKLISGTEVLLYDFSLDDGDVISYAGYNFTAAVDAITVLDGSTRKRITLKSAEFLCGQNLTQVWIEGVGGVEHPFYPGFNMIGAVCSGGGGYDIITKCSFQNGEQVYGPANCSLQLAVQDFLGATADDILLFPNPASDMVQVSLQNNSETLDRITVYDLLGKLVHQVSNIGLNQSSISVGSLAKGMYLIEITTESQMKTTKKLIIK